MDHYCSLRSLWEIDPTNQNAVAQGLLALRERMGLPAWAPGALSDAVFKVRREVPGASRLLVVAGDLNACWGFAASLIELLPARVAALDAPPSTRASPSAALHRTCRASLTPSDGGRRWDAALVTADRWTPEPPAARVVFLLGAAEEGRVRAWMARARSSASMHPELTCFVMPPPAPAQAQESSAP